jgi:altered-inheritance-of-mitochondria protein 5
MVGVATTPTGIADVEIATDDGLQPLTPVQKALRQRYQRPEAKHNKTVEQALQERYTPMDKRDNTVLRGI